METGGQCWFETELDRLTGEILHALPAGKENEIETCFKRAVEIASRHGSKSLELRASTSLARLWQSRGKSTEARNLLAPVYGWFTEGFDTADLKEAKALLDELG